MEHVIPGTQNLTTFLDKRILVYLRDGRKLFGVLRSFDQFGNLILHDTIERYYVDLEWADEPHGVYLVRGENVVLLGDLDEHEFKSITKRMAKFRRPLAQILPRIKDLRRQESLVRQTSDTSDFNFY